MIRPLCICALRPCEITDEGGIKKDTIIGAGANSSTTWAEGK